MKRIIRYSAVLLLLLIGTLVACDSEKEVKLKIVQTSDIHGNYYPHDFILQREAAGSLARVFSFVQKERETYKDNLILLDNGDILQGQPAAYYYNYIDTVSPHLTAEMLNFMGYAAANMGNHDVETGRAVFDRWAGDCQIPVLGANIVDAVTGEPHFPPYAMLERDGVKIAVLGMITPAIPVWLPQNLWKGLRFDDMEETAHKWMKIIRDREGRRAGLPDQPVHRVQVRREDERPAGHVHERHRHDSGEPRRCPGHVDSGRPVRRRPACRIPIHRSAAARRGHVQARRRARSRT